MRRAVPIRLFFPILLTSCLATPQPPSPSPSPSSSSSSSSSSDTLIPATSTMSAAPSAAGGNNLLWNGAFDASALRPWSANFASTRTGKLLPATGELCIEIDRPGASRSDIVLRQASIAFESGHRYQLRFRVHATAPTRLRPRLGKAGFPYTESWSAVVDAGPEARTYSAVFEAAASEPTAELVVEMGGALSGPAPLTVCLDDFELNDPAFEPPVEKVARAALPLVRVNQVGYLPGLAKTATVVLSGPGPAEWELLAADGAVRARGKTRPFGEDRSSGERVHQIDFSSFKATARGLKLRVGSAESVPFDVAPDVYHRLKYDALAFFYLQRSGVPIEMPYAGSPAYAHPPGHPGDRSVPCAPEAHCDYALDASGGWYDAGDQGKYIVSSAITVWTLLDQWEVLALLGATAGDFGDGRMNIPERKNGKPDLLDEVRFNLEFMLRMQVPAGKPFAGMVHHKIHGVKWSAIPTLPHEDTIKRYLRPVSTAATLDLAATAAQAARVWRAIDPPFAQRCAAAAETAFAAARQNPAVRAEREVEGGGAYGDGDLDDELFWAATELYLTTGKAAYHDEMARSRYFPGKSSIRPAAAALNWDHVAALGQMSLAIVPSALGEALVATQRREITAAADLFLGTIDHRGYRAPLMSDGSYAWGSNSNVLNAALVMGAAYSYTHDIKYANGVIDSLDYILGRNPMAMSYVAGYGARAMRNPHHRFWAHQKDARLPEAPPGAVSGGPNSMLQDPYIRKLGMSGCPPQTCYVDNIDSYSTNEVAINWNAPLAWTTAFLDDLAQRR